MFFASAVLADGLRVATFNTELSRKGPGLLLRDILKGDDPQVEAILRKLGEVDADVVALQGIDYDLDLLTLKALTDAMRSLGVDYPFIYAAPPNAGLMTGQDLDGDGKLAGPGDAQGYGRFFGQGSMAVISRYPILKERIIDHSGLLWRNLPDALLPETDAGPFPGPAAQAIQRLHAHGAWVVPIKHPGLGRVDILTFHASPPVFDGPEDRNGRRNHDEIRFWSLFMAGAFGPAPDSRFVLMGDANVDPSRGDGIAAAIKALLADTRIQDPLPDRPTVNWTQTGPMRVDYVLPSGDWSVLDAGVTPPDPVASRHQLVWIDLKPPP